MTFEPTNPIPGENADDDLAAAQQMADDGPSLIARFSRYLAARRTAGLGHRDPDTTETEELWP